MSDEQNIPKGAHITGEARARLMAELKRAYESGRSIRSLAAEHGRSYGATYSLLTQAGVRFRNRGGDMRSPSR